MCDVPGLHRQAPYGGRDILGFSDETGTVDRSQATTNRDPLRRPAPPQPHKPPETEDGGYCAASPITQRRSITATANFVSARTNETYAEWNGAAERDATATAAPQGWFQHGRTTAWNAPWSSVNERRPAKWLRSAAHEWRSKRWSGFACPVETRVDGRWRS